MNITNTGTPPVFLIDRATSGTSIPFQNIGSHKDYTVTYTSEGTTSGGTLLVEESDLPSYTGTWSQVHSQAASGFTGNAKLCVHVQIGAGMWTRVRISSAITGGGTATATMSGA